VQNQVRRLQPTSGWRWLQGAGAVRGPLIGGCLEVLDWLRGTAFWPAIERWQGAILFLETSEEAPPPLVVQRFLRSLAALDVLPQLGAILFGRPGGTIPVEQHSAYDEIMQQTISEEYGLSQLPIVTNMDFGHTDPMFVLPYGVSAELDCDTQRFSILEAAVSARF
jgi:muramoyltetrapeptide carboxypeptidase LdcA involved in peptidoglycan recycling